jgi:hypothetical protein
MNGARYNYSKAYNVPNRSGEVYGEYTIIRWDHSIKSNKERGNYQFYLCESPEGKCVKSMEALRSKKKVAEKKAAGLWIEYTN